ncbi:PRC-barrel domain-containing protein [Paracoccus sp. R86501]|uniref:PRC-barrel domain-containing protein n=1 Tax=Paracoccus sp. R86501 TaxID=3101711 RepID=UPI003670FAAA
MRNLLLTTAIALPMTFGAAFAQEAEPATDPAMEQTETAPMETEGTDTMADPAADPAMENADADEAAAAASAAEKVEQQQAENEWRVDWITGTSVTSPEGESIGDINDLIVDSETGEMKAAIIGVGGFLGMGEKQIALPWTDLTVNSDAQEITTDLTTEEADAAPEYVFRDREAAAGDMAAEGDMATDPAATDTMATEPAAEPMAEEGMAEGVPVATENAMEAEHGDDHMDTDMDGDMDGDAATDMETEEETAPAN